MTCSRFALDPNADTLHQVILLVPWALKISICYNLGIFVSCIGWVLLTLALIKLLSFASPVSERSAVCNPSHKPTPKDSEVAKSPIVKLFTFFSIAHGSICAALIFWDQGSPLWRPFLLATAALYSISIAAFVTSLVAVLTPRILGIPLKTRNMGGGQRWPDVEKAHRSQEDDGSGKARCEAEEASSEAKPAETTSNMHHSSPQSTYMHIISRTSANQTTSVTDDFHGTGNDAMEMDTADQLLISNGIDPNTLTLSQIQTFRAQRLVTQLTSIRIYKEILAKKAHLQTPHPVALDRQSTYPNGGLDFNPSDLMSSQAPSPYDGNREAETADPATMQERYLQQPTIMTGRKQDLLLTAQALPQEGTSTVEQARNDAVAGQQTVIESQMPFKLADGIHKAKVPNDGRPPVNIEHQPSQQASHALMNYQMQIKMLEQQNKKRLLLARQEQDSVRPLDLPGGIHNSKAIDDGRPPVNFGSQASEQGSHALMDYQMQLMLLEQQNKKRLLMLREMQGFGRPLELHGGIDNLELPNDDHPPVNISHQRSRLQALNDYQMQLMLFEQQNKKRLLMARQLQDDIDRRASKQE